jgi:hypothetical protein
METIYSQNRVAALRSARYIATVAAEGVTAALMGRDRPGFDLPNTVSGRLCAQRLVELQRAAVVAFEEYLSLHGLSLDDARFAVMEEVPSYVVTPEEAEMFRACPRISPTFKL